MRVHIQDSNVVSLADKLRKSIAIEDAKELGTKLENFGQHLVKAGVDIQQVAELGDEPSIFELGRMVADFVSGVDIVFAYAVSRGIRLASSPVLPVVGGE